jgi:hypothetical protein
VADALEQRTAVLEPDQRPGELPGCTEAIDERAARRTLRDQVERLEYELSSLVVSAWPRRGLDLPVGGRSGPGLLSLGELEELRDDLVGRAEYVRAQLAEGSRLEEQHRRRIEEMLLEPERHKWLRIGNEHIGEPGCKHWHVQPRWGILGMLMNWWRVRISSGCPLPSHGAA